MTPRFLFPQRSSGDFSSLAISQACDRFPESLPEGVLLKVPDVSGFYSRSAGYTEENAYLPDPYVPSYSYPLIVWVEVGTSSRVDLPNIMPVISERNYCAVKVELSQESRYGVETPESLVWNWSKQIRRAVRRFEQRYNIHPDRVYLAGLREAGQAALHVLQDQPARYAGAILVHHEIRSSDINLTKFRQLQGKRVLQMNAASFAPLPQFDAREIARTLHSAGMSLASRQYPSSQPFPRTLLLDIDRWIMAGICQPQQA